jgi:hypothetical protein
MEKTHKVIKYKFSSDDAVNWFEFITSYYQASRCLIVEYKTPAEDWYKKPILLIPLLYCIRHCIELLLKFLSLANPEKLFSTHDISSLMEKHKKFYENADKSILNKVAEILKTPQSHIEATYKKNLERLEIISKKYSDVSFLLDDGFIIDDKKNEVFRYPVTFDTGFRFDFENLQLKTSADEIIEDLDFLLGYSFVVMFFFIEGPDGRPLLESFPEYWKGSLPL